MTDLVVSQRVSQDEFDLLCDGPITSLRLDDARNLVDLLPLVRLTSLTGLTINLPFQVADLAPLAQLTSLAEIRYGNSDLGNDRVVAVPDLRWVAPLVRLESVQLVGTRLIDKDLSPLLALPRLREVGLPLRRSYRATVFAYAEDNHAFAELAVKYRALDAFTARANGGS